MISHFIYKKIVNNTEKFVHIICTSLRGIYLKLDSNALYGDFFDRGLLLTLKFFFIFLATFENFTNAIITWSTVIKCICHIWLPICKICCHKSIVVNIFTICECNLKVMHGMSNKSCVKNWNRNFLNSKGHLSLPKLGSYCLIYSILGCVQVIL